MLRTRSLEERNENSNASLIDIMEYLLVNDNAESRSSPSLSAIEQPQVRVFLRLEIFLSGIVNDIMIAFEEEIRRSGSPENRKEGVIASE